MKYLYLLLIVCVFVLAITGCGQRRPEEPVVKTVEPNLPQPVDPLLQQILDIMTQPQEKTTPVPVVKKRFHVIRKDDLCLNNVRLTVMLKTWLYKRQLGHPVNMEDFASISRQWLKQE